MYVCFENRASYNMYTTYSVCYFSTWQTRTNFLESHRENANTQNILLNIGVGRKKIPQLQWYDPIELY